MVDALYLDHNATTPLFPEVVARMTELLERTGNPSSLHSFGRAARCEIENARERVAALVKASPPDVIFTSGGTEANALALVGCGRDNRLISAVEHESVRQCALGASPLSVTGNGIIDLEALRERLERTHGSILVSVTLADGQSGIVQPVSSVAEIAHEYGALVHCDAVQAAGRMPIDVRELGADLVSLSAHKMGGPQGVGALVVARQGLDLHPLFRGGGQERGRRGGTENVAAIMGFGIAAELTIPYMITQEKVRDWRDDMERRLSMIRPDVTVFGKDAPRLANTSCFALSGGASGRTQVMGLDLADIAVSAGSACSSGKLEPPHALLAMGVPADLARCAIRVSFGWTNVEGDGDRFLRAWERLTCRQTTGSAR